MTRSVVDSLRRVAYGVICALPYRAAPVRSHISIIKNAPTPTGRRDWERVGPGSENLYAGDGRLIVDEIAVQLGGDLGTARAEDALAEALECPLLTRDTRLARSSGHEIQIVVQ